MISVNIELVFHGTEIVVIGAGFWKLVRVATRLLDVMEDFPPHRHVNGKVLFPKGYAPPRIERMGSDGC